MFEFDILIILTAMTLAFYRQMSVYKESYKISFAPLLFGMGVLGALFHFIYYASADNLLLNLKISMLPFGLGLIYYIIINVILQIQKREDKIRLKIRENERDEEVESYRGKVEAMLDIFDKKMALMYESDLKREALFKDSFKEDIDALQRIFENQNIFVSKIETLLTQQKESLANFENFTTKELPDIDQVIHRHIDMLRISEQDHHNKTKDAISNIQKEHISIENELVNLQHSVNSLLPSFKEITTTVVAHTSKELNILFSHYDKEMQNLRAQSQSLSLLMSENENTISNSKDQSSLLLKQMVLASNRMEELLNLTPNLEAIFTPIEKVKKEIDAIRKDYVRARINLDGVSESMQEKEMQQFSLMSEEIKSLSEVLRSQIESSLEELHKTYHLAQNEISTSVKELTLKAQMAKSYGGDVESMGHVNQKSWDFEN
jgi:hypothetical protein